jgi:hypothetical protein
MGRSEYKWQRDAGQTSCAHRRLTSLNARKWQKYRRIGSVVATDEAGVRFVRASAVLSLLPVVSPARIVLAAVRKL